jgi:hypothetical protein
MDQRMKSTNSLTRKDFMFHRLDSSKIKMENSKELHLLSSKMKLMLRKHANLTERNLAHQEEDSGLTPLVRSQLLDESSALSH